MFLRSSNDCARTSPSSRRAGWSPQARSKNCGRAFTSKATAAGPLGPCPWKTISYTSLAAHTAPETMCSNGSADEQAPKGRQNVAHDVSHGNARQRRIESPEGAKETQLEFLSPLRGLTSFGYCLPKACAVGYILSPLTGAYVVLPDAVAPLAVPRTRSVSDSKMKARDL